MISRLANQSTTEDTPTAAISFNASDEDYNDTIAITADSSDTSLLPVDYTNNILITDNGDGTCSLTLVPAADTYGYTNVTLTATDASGKSDSTTFRLIVYPQNDAPAAADETYSIDEDSSVTLRLLDNDSDPDGDTIWVSSISAPAHGWLTYDGPNYVYVPYSNWNGTETLSYQITDGSAYDTATVTVNVAAVNDAPVNYSSWLELPNTEGASGTSTRFPETTTPTEIPFGFMKSSAGPATAPQRLTPKPARSLIPAPNLLIRTYIQMRRTG